MRLSIGDLFSGCAYVRTYMVVTLRNVNLQSCLGMSIRAHAQNQASLTRGRRWRKELGGANITWRWRTGKTRAWAFATYVFGGVKCRNKCSTQPTASDSDKEKSKEVSPPQKQREQEENKKEFKSRKHVLESLHKPGNVLWAPTKPAAHTCSARLTRMRNAHRHTGACHSVRHHTHAYS